MDKIFIETTQEEYDKKYKKDLDELYQIAVKGTGLDILCPTRDDVPEDIKIVDPIGDMEKSYLGLLKALKEDNIKISTEGKNLNG